jgi:hypothetical protein
MHKKVYYFKNQSCKIYDHLNEDLYEQLCACDTLKSVMRIHITLITRRYILLKLHNTESKSSLCFGNENELRERETITKDHKFHTRDFVRK